MKRPIPHFFFCAMLACLMAVQVYGAKQHHPATAEELQQAFEECQSGDHVILGKRAFVGNFRIATSIHLSSDGGVLDGASNGTVLTLDAPDIQIKGIHIRNSGRNLSGRDAAIYLTPKASGSHISNMLIENSAFGIWVHECKNVTLNKNRIEGIKTGHTSNRGNGIQLFDSSELTVTGNSVRNGRDGIYISATENSLIEGNDVERARYGIHYMYSYSNKVRNNVCRHNNHGFALMESKHLLVENNRSEHNDGQGLQFRDAQYCTIQNNILSHNQEGLFFYSSTNNNILNNEVIHNKVGVKIWAGSLRNRVEGNRFIGNAQQVFYVGSTEIEWGESGRGNYWADYLGWDQDGDGIGDRPYRVNSFNSRLLYRFPAASLLLNSPSLETLSLLERRLPILRTPTITDRHPLIESTIDE